MAVRRARRAGDHPVVALGDGNGHLRQRSWPTGLVQKAPYPCPSQGFCMARRDPLQIVVRALSVSSRRGTQSRPRQKRTATASAVMTALLAKMTNA
jgi:hypothetical protein